ncbi:MAG: 4'-phosphopantetheinyl transferase superfamily protein [Legionellales bacterium]|nr:4'-phosphopantetheinyl transferase superfamily protein [Legionellales bacterium]
MTQWLPLPTQMECGSGYVYLIGISYDANLHSTGYSQFLSPTEKERASKFKFPIHRERFTFFHACLRNILARFLHCSPDALFFFQGEYGKPYLDKKYQLQFNLSHSENEAIVAITKDAEIGVDIEKVKLERSDDGIAKRFFSPIEYVYLSQLDEEKRKEAFFQFWAHKEAFIKATGKGLSQDLKSFSIGLHPSRLITADNECCDEWTIQSFVWKAGFMAAFATHQINPEIQFFSYAQ